MALFQASMLSQPDGPFINVPKLNLAKYGQRQNLAKVKYIQKTKAAIKIEQHWLRTNGTFLLFLVTF
jgi:hypothetical protein